MTIATNDRRKRYPGNGVATVFTGPRAFSAAHISVYLVDNVTNVATLQASGYTVTGINKDSTTVTMDVAPPSTVTLLILRVVPYEQAADISNQGAYFPETLETAGLDPLAQQAQQLAELQDRSMHFADTAEVPAGVSTELPLPVHGNLLGWLNNGVTTRLENFPPGDANADFLVPLPGGVSHSIRTKLTEQVSVLDFGAIGDGATDDTIAINAALAASSGRTLLFRPGNYKTSATLVLPSNITIMGRGATIVPIDAGSFPVYQALDDAVDLPGGMALGSKPILSNSTPATGNSNITIIGLSWTGNATGSPSMHGLHMNKITGLRIEGCSTYECLSAIALLESTDVYIVGNTVKGFRNGGIDTWAGCKRVHIARNIVDGVAPNSDGTNYGILCTSEPSDPSVNPGTYCAEDYLIENNIITNIEWCGILMGGGDTTADRVNDLARRVHIRNNVIRDSGQFGMILNRSEDCVVEGNNILNCAFHGIYAHRGTSTATAYLDRLTIANNRIRNVGLTVGSSHFVSMDQACRDAMVYGNRGSGTTHAYALYDRATNSGLIHYANRWAAGTSGTFSILTTDDLGVPDGRYTRNRQATTAATPIVLFDAAVQGAAWEVILQTATVAATATSYARFIVYGNTTLPKIVAQETFGTTTYTLALSGTNIQATSSTNTSLSTYSWRRL